MPLDVRIRDRETQESLLQRFQKAIQMSGILRETKAKNAVRSVGGKG